MSTKPSPVNRRRALAAGAASLGALALAACGESPTERAADALPEGLQAELQRNLERARAEARNVTQAAPRAAVNLPAPGAGHPVTVAMYPSNRVGGSLFGQFVNGLAAARERAEERYAYTEAALDYGRNASTFSISTSLDAVVNANPDLVIYFRADQADLLANDRLAPLDDFLVSDPDFNSADFWPGLLDTGRHEGAQYGLPVAVSPHVLLFNRSLATELQVEPPLPDPLAFDAEVFLDTVRRLHMEPPPSGGLGSMGYISRFTPEPNANGDYSASPSPFELLQSAVGDIRGPGNDFAPLTSPPAIAVAEFLRAWVHDHRLAITDGSNTRSFRRTGQFGFTGTILAFLAPSSAHQRRPGRLPHAQHGHRPQPGLRPRHDGRTGQRQESGTRLRRPAAPGGGPAIQFRPPGNPDLSRRRGGAHAGPARGGRQPGRAAHDQRRLFHPQPPPGRHHHQRHRRRHRLRRPTPPRRHASPRRPPPRRQRWVASRYDLRGATGLCYGFAAPRH